MRDPWWAALGEHHLFVTGLGQWGRGLYEVGDREVVAVDDVATVGLCCGGGAAWRVLRAPGELTGTCELLRYDDRGVDRYWRFDEVRDPHDVCWHDGALHLVSSWDGLVWRLAGDQLEPVWRGGEVPDSWHPNCLVSHEGRLFVSAFGRGDVHKGFGPLGSPAAGFVHDVGAGVDVATGLAQPHQARPHRGGWLVCESTRSALTELPAEGEPRRLDVGRYTRGLAVCGRWAFVGANARRDEEDADRAEVVVVDLDGWAVVDRVGLPCLEVYDVVAVPPELAVGLRTGFATNAFRVGEQAAADGRPAEQRPVPPSSTLRLATAAQAAAVTATASPVELGELRGAVRAELPARLVAGGWVTVPARVRNDSACTWATLLPHPLSVTPRWYRLGAAAGEDPGTAPAPATPLPRPLPPGAQVDVQVLVGAPEVPGRYRLSLTLRQHGVGWFGVRAEREVEVVAPGATRLARRT